MGSGLGQPSGTEGLTGSFIAIRISLLSGGPMMKTKNVGKRESFVRSVLGGVLIDLAFFISGIFWLGVGLIGVVLVVSALFKY
jgi:hypothetical protein